MEIKELEEQRNNETTGFFRLGLQVAFIFIIPALIAVFIGKKLNSHFNMTSWSIICLTFSFILSWVVVGVFYNKKSKKLEAIEKQIRTLKEAENLDKNKEN